MITSNPEAVQDVAPVIEDAQVIDTSDLDIFSSLDDVVVEDAPTQVEKVEKDDVADVEDGATEEVEESEDDEVDFDDLDDAEQDENGHDIEDEDGDDDGDDETPDEDEGEEADEELEGDDSEQEVDFDEYTVTLPDGEDVSLSEAIKGYKDAQALEAERVEFEEHKTEFKSQTENVSKMLELAKLEADRVVEDYKDFDWQGLAKEDPQAYVDNKEFLDRYIKRRDEIKTAQEKMSSERAEQEAEEHKLRAKSAVSVLQQEIPGWNQDLYSDLIDYAVDSGVPEKEILNATDPQIFILLNKARQFDKGRQVVKAKIKRQSKSPKKVVKPQSKRVAKPDNTKAKMERLIDSGQVGDSDLFNSLED